MKRRDTVHVNVEVTGLATGGEAVGRQVGGEHDGRAVFVAYAAPGEVVRARLVKEKARVAWGELEAVERRSPERVDPVCPLFGRCGGCQWQHVSRAAQLAAKRQIVERALGRPLEGGVQGVVEVGPAYGYRDRARLVVGKGADGKRAIGFRAWKSHAIVDVPRCPLLGPELAAALPAARARAERSRPGTEIVLQAGGDDVSVGLQPVGGPRAQEGSAPSMVDVAEAGSPSLRVPAGAFAQVGRQANRALVAALLEQVGPQPGRVLELYAGSGNFTRHLVERASAVVASDVDAASMERGRRQVPAARWVSTPWAEPDAPDTVVVDPPREGLDAAHLAMAAAARQRIVYVSCDPQTLGRDARRLGEAGFVLDRVVALDLMPQTFHVEVVASFRRGATPPG